MKKYLLLLSMSSVIALSACGDDTSEEVEAPNAPESEETNDSDDSASTSNTSEADAGHEAYQNNSCVGCHGQDLEGGSGPALTDVGNELSDDEIRTIIEEGGNGMPGGLVEGEELDALVTWLSGQTE